MVKTKELIICIISMIALVLAITTNVFATGELDINALLANTSNNEYGQVPEIKNNTVNTLNTNTNVVNVNAKTNNITNNITNTMPNTGVSYSSIVIIAICGISAIYAYKKIREYNI